MRCALLVALGLLEWGRLASAAPPKAAPLRDTPNPSAKPGSFVFNFLPKAFQANPTMETTVYTEVSEFGKKLIPPSPEHPAYFFLHSSGFKQLGHETPGGEKSPSPAEMERVLIASLARNNYRVTDSPEHPATLLVIYFWGSFAALDQEQSANFPVLAHQEYIKRATLVGGVKFAQDADFTFTYGETPREQIGKARDLRDQAADDLYYVVATAYGFTKEGRKQIWRTTMTVNSRGVSMTETLQPLIELAAPYFGRDLREPEIISERINRNAHVEIGTPRVVPDKK